MAQIPNAHDSLFPMRDYLNQKFRENKEREEEEGYSQSDSHMHEASFEVTSFDVSHSEVGFGGQSEGVSHEKSNDFFSANEFGNGGGLEGQHIASGGGFSGEMGSFQISSFEGHTDSFSANSAHENSFSSSASFGQSHATFGEVDFSSQSSTSFPSTCSPSPSPSPSASFPSSSQNSFGNDFSNEGNLGYFDVSHQSHHSAISSGSAADISAPPSDATLTPLESALSLSFFVIYLRFIYLTLTRSLSSLSFLFPSLPCTGPITASKCSD